MPNIPTYNKNLRTSYISMLLAIFAILFLTACMPLNDKNVNNDLFKSKEELKTKTSELKAGMNKDEVFELLGVPMGKFDQLGTVDIQRTLYGDSQLQGTPEQLEEFRKKLMRFEGYSLPYQSIKSKGSLGFGKLKVKKTGHNLLLVLIFENGKLLKATVEGKQDVNEKEDQFFWNTILRTGVKAAI